MERMDLFSLSLIPFSCVSHPIVFSLLRKTRHTKGEREKGSDIREVSFCATLITPPHLPTPEVIGNDVAQIEERDMRDRIGRKKDGILRETTSKRRESHLPNPSHRFLLLLSLSFPVLMSLLSSPLSTERT